MTEKYLISVIIPTHNRVNLLLEAIDSVRNQTYRNVEIVVIDDKSSDNTEEVVNDLVKIDSRIKYFKNVRNSGPSATRNIGIDNTKGEFISFLDDDDVWEPEKLEKQLKTALSLECISLIFCNGFCPGTIKKYAWDVSIQNDFIKYKKNEFPLKVSLPPPSSWFMHKDIIKKTGKFDESLMYWEDQDYVLRIFLNFSVYFLNELLVKWGEAENHLYTLSEKLMDAKELFLSKHENLMRKDKDYLFRFYYRLGKDCKELNKRDRARKYFLKALKLKPFKLELLAKIL